MEDDVLHLTGELRRSLKLPVTRSEAEIREFCFNFNSTSLVFCTVSGAARLQGQRMDLLLIDEAAQLKECESLIPVALRRLKRAVLIGDECQAASCQLLSKARYNAVRCKTSWSQ